jgi:hypothetical protein
MIPTINFFKVAPRLTCGAAVLLATGLAFGYGAHVSKKVQFIRVDRDGRGMVEFSGEPAGTPPACVIANYRNYMAFNAANTGGKSLLATLTAAKMTDRNVTVYGTGACDWYPSIVEDISYINLE